MQQYPTAEELYDDVEEDESPPVFPDDDPAEPPVAEPPWPLDDSDDAILDPALLAPDESPWERLWEEAVLICWPLWSLQQHAPPSAEHAGATASHAPPSMAHPSTVVHDVPRKHACCDMDDEAALAGKELEAPTGGSPGTIGGKVSNDPPPLLDIPGGGSSITIGGEVPPPGGGEPPPGGGGVVPPPGGGGVPPPGGGRPPPGGGGWVGGVVPPPPSSQKFGLGGQISSRPRQYDRHHEASPL